MNNIRWGWLFLTSGAIIILAGYILLRLIVPWCPVGEPNMVYRTAMGSRVFILFSILGGTLALFGLALLTGMVKDHHVQKDELSSL